MPDLTVIRTRLQRLVDERGRTAQLIDDLVAAAENDERDLNDSERETLARYRARIPALDTEIDELTDDCERNNASATALERLRRAVPASVTLDQPTARPDGNGAGEPEVVYRHFAHWARDALISRFDQIASRAGGEPVRQAARDRLIRVPANTTTAEVAGLLPPTHMSQIMDIISASRPLVESARSVDLVNGKLTYPKITQRPLVSKQAAEKTETASQAMNVSLEEMMASTFLGAGDLSWQTINWSSPGALELWFDLAAEEYARQTETEAGTALAAITTTSPVPATSDLEGWWAAIIAAAEAVYTATGGRVIPNTVWAGPDRFFELLALMAPQGTSPVFTGAGTINLTTMSGTVAGFRLIGSYGLAAGTVIVGDSRAFLKGETPGAPVELRAVEPSIAGMEVGVVGAFAAKVFDEDRFVSLSGV
jgi:HK97 family phage major capsid protein